MAKIKVLVINDCFLNTTSIVINLISVHHGVCMIQSYVISLESAIERRKHIREEFGKQGIDFKFFDAVTPPQVSRMAEEFSIDIMRADLTQGELACLFSHVQLWKKCIDEDLDYIAVFEDDVYLGENANLFLTKKEWIPKNIGIVRLEIFEPIVVMQHNFIPTLDDRKLKKAMDIQFGSAGYIINKDTCFNLLNFLSKSAKLVPVDHLLFEVFIKKGLANIYQITPAFCVQSDRLFLIKNHSNNDYKVYNSDLEKSRRERFEKNRKEKFEKKQKLERTKKIKRELIRIVNNIFNIKYRIYKIFLSQSIDFR